MKSVAKYGHSSFDSLIEQLNRYKDSEDPEILHIIRVDLKKIKALFNLINFCYDKFDVSDRYKSLRKIFKNSGSIRKFDIMDQILHQYKIVSSNADEISRKNYQKEIIIKFKNNISHYNKIVKKQDIKTASFYKKINIKNLKKFIQKKEKELDEKLTLCFKKKDLHDDRKLIKEIIYLSSVKKDNSKQMDYYDKLQHVIGDWHDKQGIVEMFKSKNKNLYAPVIKTLKVQSINDIKKLKSLISK